MKTTKVIKRITKVDSKSTIDNVKVSRLTNIKFSSNKPEEISKLKFKLSI